MSEDDRQRQAQKALDFARNYGSGSKLSWTQPQCEACWIEQNMTHGDDAVFSIRRPTVLVQEHTHIEFCAWCGKPTIMGIYVRADPKTVPYPSKDDE